MAKGITDKLCATCSTRMMQVPGTRKYCDACQEAQKIRYCRRCGIVPLAKGQHFCDACAGRDRPKAERLSATQNQEITHRRANGELLKDLADFYEVTPQRISQISKERRGGDHGGGTTVKTVELSEKAARYVMRKATISGTRYRKEEANKTASAILEALADGTLVSLSMTNDLHAALPWLEEAKRICTSKEAKRGLDQLIAAIWATPPSA